MLPSGMDDENTVAPRRFGRPRLLPPPPRRPLDDPDASFADLLCGFRQRLGWAQTALGARADVNASYINRLESGGRGGPTAEIVCALAAGLGLSLEETDRLLWSAGCLPDGLRRLPCGDPTILAVARLLGDRRLSPEALADFRACVEAMARRWQGDPR
jgi:transcriptional regulator with XRE-family HTH domain